MPATFSPADWYDHVTRLAADCAGQGRPVNFIQIGAMDGVQFDPLHNHISMGGPGVWQGGFCEPMPFHQTALKQAYQGLPGLTFIEAAVVASSGPVEMTYIPPAVVEQYNIKRHAAGMGCVDYARSGFAKQTAEGRALLEPLMEKITVRGITLNEAIAEAGLENIDVYVSDTEGYDGIILQQLDTARFQPKLILIEHEHMTQDEKVMAIARLRPLGYREYFAHGNDGEDLLFVRG